MIWFRLYSSCTIVEDIKSKSQEKHWKLWSNFSPLLSCETNTVHTIFQQASYFWLLFVSSSLLCSLIKITSKNLPLASCLGESKFCWQSAKIRVPYHLGSLYSKWLALKSRLLFKKIANFIGKLLQNYK